jgi:hypothetical protein
VESTVLVLTFMFRRIFVGRLPRARSLSSQEIRN